MQVKLAFCAYGFDLTPDGKVGNGTVRRLKKAVARYHRQGGVIVVAATKSPYHDVHIQMAEVMRDWCYEHDVSAGDVWVLKSTTFDTGGEARAFAPLVACEQKVYVSSWWHLLRCWRLVRKIEKHQTVKYIPVWDLPTPKMLALEVGKHIAMCFSPESQHWCKQFATRLLGRTSY